MTDSKRVPRDDVETRVRELYALIEPPCERIQIAGSYRRKLNDVKDIEFVAIPTLMTYQALDRMVLTGEIIHADYGGTERWGKLYRGLMYRGLRCELFFTDADSWGYQLWLRTGPADAGRFAMQRMQQSRMRCLDGAVWVADDWTYTGDKWTSDTKQQIAVPDETRFFHLLGMEWIAPEARSVAVYDRYIGTARTPFAPPESWLTLSRKPQQMTLL